jgi:PadR family transcriptional regulator, regulatory protein PadR
MVEFLHPKSREDRRKRRHNRNGAMTKQQPVSEALRGSLDLLILKTLSLEPMHGWGITQRIEDQSGGVLEVNQGSLYPALQRLEQRGWIDSDWQTTENNRRAKYYRLTTAGRSALVAEEASWQRYISAVQAVLDAG